ncbi:MAG: hypothetical protein MK033_10355 [Candidatus Caenarcaniphilales bacterium]|nr:hypothetical protein [Candidatus Caenarcaniphilales bacterium]
MLIDQESLTSINSLDSLSPMERDELLLKSFEQKSQRDDFVLFFYLWEHETVSLGKAQRSKKVLLDELKQLGIKSSIRPTGGKTIFHFSDVSFTFIAKQDSPIFGGSLRDSYGKSIGFLKQILFDFFLEYYSWDLLESISNVNEAVNCSGSGFMQNCFDSSYSCELLLNYDNQARKILGSAQTMYANSFLQQGSVLVNSSQNYFGPIKDLSFYRDYISLVDIFNNSQDIDLKILVEDLNLFIAESLKVEVVL